jgi:hypothetical protein
MSISTFIISPGVQVILRAVRRAKPLAFFAVLRGGYALCSEKLTTDLIAYSAGTGSSIVFALLCLLSVSTRSAAIRHRIPATKNAGI